MIQLSGLQLEEVVKQLLALVEKNESSYNYFYDKSDKFVSANIISGQEVMLSGVFVVEAVFKIIDPNIKVKFFYKDGDFIDSTSVVMKISGSLVSICRAERLVLSIVSRMSNISTYVFSCSSLLQGEQTNLVLPRAFTPGFKLLEYIAAELGGALKQKFFFGSGLHITNYHVRYYGSVTKSINKLTEVISPLVRIVFHASSLNDVHEAIAAGVQFIVLKDMSIANVKMALRSSQKRVLFEYNSCLFKSEITAVASLGVHFVSDNNIIYTTGWSGFYLSVI
jgi:nicotinate-nucleotide pyrophosphorylase (carboxylating)